MHSNIPGIEVCQGWRLEATLNIMDPMIYGSAKSCLCKINKIFVNLIFRLEVFCFQYSIVQSNLLVEKVMKD
jgi:hypothetical protein